MAWHETELVCLVPECFVQHKLCCFQEDKGRSTKHIEALHLRVKEHKEELALTKLEVKRSKKILKIAEVHTCDPTLLLQTHPKLQSPGQSMTRAIVSSQHVFITNTRSPVLWSKYIKQHLTTVFHCAWSLHLLHQSYACLIEARSSLI